MCQSVPKQYEPFGGDINVKVDWSNYAAKADLKTATGIDTSELVVKSDSASLKNEIYKIDVQKIKTAPVHLSKLSKVVNNDVAKKTVYDKLVPKVITFDISRFVLKIKYTQADQT